MSTSKNIDKICMVILVLTVIITALFVNGEKLGIKVIKSEENEGYFTKNDLDSSFDKEASTLISLKKDSAEINGTGAYTSDGNLYIVCGGDYVLSGELSDGSIIINADKSDKIRLILNSVKINCNDNAVLFSKKADKVFLILAENTENTFYSGENYSSEAQEEKIDGCIYSKTDLTITGKGKLSVSGEYSHGIVCNDDLKITGGEVSVTAKQDTVHANESVRLTKAILNLSAGDDGITVSNDKSTDYLYIESGKINIEKCYEGLEATTVTVKGGEITVNPEDDGINAMKLIEINGGNINIINQNGRDADGFDSNGDININGGNILISVPGDSSCALDYGSEIGGKCLINGGTVIACGGSNMLEEISNDSKQAFIIKTVSGDAESILSLKSSDGKELISETIPVGFSAVILSTPEIKTGEEYTLIAGETEEKITAEKEYEISGGFGGKGNNKPERTDDAGNDQNGNKRENFENSGETRPQMPDFNGDNGEDMPQMENGTQPPQIPDGESGDFTDKPDFKGEPPEGMREKGDNMQPSQTTDKDSEENTSSNSNKKSFKNRNFSEKSQNNAKKEMQRDDKDNAVTDKTTDKKGIVLIGASILLLIAGLLIAVKKKY